MGVTTFYTLRSQHTQTETVIKQLQQVKKELHGEFNLIADDETAPLIVTMPEIGNIQDKSEIERFQLYDSARPDYHKQLAEEEGLIITADPPELAVGS